MLRLLTSHTCLETSSTKQRCHLICFSFLQLAWVTAHGKICEDRCLAVGVCWQKRPRCFTMAFAHAKHNNPSWCGKVGRPLTGRGVISLVLKNDNTSRFLHKHHPTPLPPALPTHTCPHRTELPLLNMDITGHFESASCVIEVDGSDTLAQVKGKLVAELGVPRARGVGVRMRGGGDIGSDDLRICDTVMDEGCAVELYCTGANITVGVIPRLHQIYSLTLSPCDRYLAVMRGQEGMVIFDTATHECLCSFPCEVVSFPAFSPCSEWISCNNFDTQCAEVHDVKTGALKHSFGDAGADRWTHAVFERWSTEWSPCGAQLLSCCSKGLQVWDIATGVVVHEWSHIKKGYHLVPLMSDKVATANMEVTIWDYTTGVEVLVLTCPSHVHYVALSPNQRFIAECGTKYVRVWNIETGECVFNYDAQSNWTDVAVSNDIVAAHSPATLCMWSISTGEQLLRREFEQSKDSYGLAISSCGGVMMYGGSDGVEIVDISHLS